MKNSILLLALAIIWTSCGFQHRKYTHGHWMNSPVGQQNPLPKDASSNDHAIHSLDQDQALQTSASSEEILVLSDHPIYSIESSKPMALDTIVPENNKATEEEDFVSPKTKKNEYATEHDPCYDPNRESLTKEVADNVLWGVLSLIGSALYFVGFIPGTIFFFKSLKTHKKIKALNSGGQYNDLKKMNFAAILANGMLFSALALTVLFGIFILVLVLTGNF